MVDFGGKLRAAREVRGVSLRQIAETTKISVSALEALERNDPSRLPGGIFTRAFVRSYAKEVGLDPDSTVREFLTRFNLDAEPFTLEAADEAATASLDRHLGGMLLKIVLASLIVAIILYLTLAKNPDTRSTTPPPGDHARRTSPRGARLM